MSLVEEQVSIIREYVKLPEYLNADGYRIDEKQRKFTIRNKNVPGEVQGWNNITKYYHVSYMTRNGMVVSSKLFCEESDFQTGDKIIFDLGSNVDYVILNPRLQEETK